jgi:hypothetical protein
VSFSSGIFLSFPLGGRGIATTGLILGYIALVLGIMGIPLLSV